MKKILILFLALTLTLTACLAFWGCGAPEDDGDDSAGCTAHTDQNGDGVCDNEGCGATVTPGGETPSGDYFNDQGELILFKDGAPTFRFVKGSDATSLMDSIDDLAALLSTLSTKPVEAVENTSTPQDVEILIGTVTTRGDTYKINKYSLGEKGYMVKQIGSKIVVLGGSSSALSTAFKYLKEEVFGMKKNNEPFGDFAMTKDKNVEAPQTDYKVKSVKIDGKSIEEYTIYYDNTTSKKVATSFRDELYSKVGVYLDITGKAVAAGTPTIQFNALENSGVGNGYEVKVEGGNLMINCEFEYMFEDLATEFYKTNITEPKTANVKFSAGVIETKDIRNIYYDDFGAVGNGEINDFEAIYNTHARANQYGHTVNGTKGKTYYIGSTGGKSITIMTDTNWNGCDFIFDDSVIPVHNTTTCPFGSTSQCVSCEERRAAIFTIKSNYATKDVTSLFAQFNKDNPLKGGYGEADNTTVIPGWNLPYDALVHIQSAERRVFIRLGMNATEGELQGEYILVHKDGTIDPKTPLTWDYSYISSAMAYNADPEYVKPITLNGGGATITTIANRPGADVGNEYISFARNLLITRSNTTVMGINHRVKESMENFRSPYNGMFYARNANNITYRDITAQTMYRRYHGALYCGSYVIGTFGCNDVKFYNLRTMEFFSDGTKPKNANGEFYPAGTIHEPGFFGSNYCRNFYFENCKLNSFDSHKGSGNVTLKNCMIGCFYVLGSGDIVLEDTVFYLDRTKQVITLRTDFATTWRGSVTLKNVDLRFAIDPPQDFVLFNSGQFKTNEDGDAVLNETTGEYVTSDGWTSYLPEKITLENVSLTKYTYTKYDKETDTVDEVEVPHSRSINLFHSSLYLYEDTNLATDYPHKQVPTEELIVTNCNFKLVVPDTPQFKDMKYLIDGEEQ